MEKTTTKPTVKLSEKDGNVFALMAICSKALKDADLRDQVEQMTNEIFASKSYDEALQVMMKYCNVE